MQNQCTQHPVNKRERNCKAGVYSATIMFFKSEVFLCPVHNHLAAILIQCCFYVRRKIKVIRGRNCCLVSSVWVSAKNHFLWGKACWYVWKKKKIRSDYCRHTSNPGWPSWAVRPPVAKKCFSLSAPVAMMAKNQAEERVTRGGRLSHLKVTEDAFDIAQYPLPVWSVCLQHLIHCLSHSCHEKIRVSDQ